MIALVRHRELHADRLCSIGRPQFRRGNAPTACRQNAGGAAAGDRRDRAALVLARSMARWLWRHPASQCFPKLMASAFAGYYLALFLILWCLILRGISLEVGGHINDRLWQGFGTSSSHSPTFCWRSFSAPRRATWRGEFRSTARAISPWHFSAISGPRQCRSARLVHGVRCGLRCGHSWRRMEQPTSP